MLVMSATHPRLAAVLRAHIHAQRVKSAQFAFLHAAALAGGLSWVCALWPHMHPAWVRTLAMVGWPVCLAIFGLFVFLQRRCDARVDRLVRLETTAAGEKWAENMPLSPAGDER